MLSGTYISGMATACSHRVQPSPSRSDLSAALALAEARSLDQGHRWTPPRQRVYELLLQAGGPVKAYDLMEDYAEGRTAKPPTIYRALEFLEQAGLVHRIPSLNAYVACSGEDAAHIAAFLICDCCGSAEEFEPGKVASAASAAKLRGFQVRAVALEVRGRCGRCPDDRG